MAIAESLNNLGEESLVCTHDRQEVSICNVEFRANCIQLLPEKFDKRFVFGPMERKPAKIDKGE